jgi:C4-dicarboxylate transporter, DctM subunit
MIALGIILLALLGVPLFAIIGLSALVSFYGAEIDSAAIFIELYRVANNPTLIAIPLFTLSGFILAHGKTPERLSRVSQSIFRGTRGGIPIAILLSCAFFTALTGASGVTIIALGGLLYPLLLKEKYSENFSLGMLTSSGSLGLLFPPSLPLILYGIIAQVSIDKLFIAGILPGLIMILIVSIFAINHSREPPENFNWSKVKSALIDSSWELPLPFIIITGIYGGFFTVTDAASVTVVYVILVESLVYKDLNVFKDLPELMKDSMVLVGSVLIILGTAMGFTNYLVDEQVPMTILATMKQYIHDPFTFLMVLNVFLLLVGCMMDIFSAIIVVVPIIIPVAQSFDINMIHLGIIFLTNLEIGYSTPPVGINLFIAATRFKKPIFKLYQAVLPFLGLRLMGLILITYVPAISLFLVNWVSG